jgi:addiction module RelE/StbE family toxin
MAQIIWSDRSLADLQEIGEFISKDSALYAKLVLEKIINSTTILESHPMIGRKVPEFHNPSLRELIIGNFRLIYKLDKNQNISILTVHHSSRLLRKKHLR